MIFVMQQLTLMARIGLVIIQSQPLKKGDSTIATSLQWLAGQASQLRFLLSENTATAWLDAQLLNGVSSLNELKREFVDIVRKAWPQALLQALSVLRSQPSRCTSAVIYEPATNSKEPREIVAQWPFTVHVKSVVENLNDLTRVFIKVYVLLHLVYVCTVSRHLTHSLLSMFYRASFRMARQRITTYQSTRSASSQVRPAFSLTTASS